MIRIGGKDSLIFVLFLFAFLSDLCDREYSCRLPRLYLCICVIFADGTVLIKTFAPRFSVQTLHSALGSSLASLPVFDLVAFVAFGILRRGIPLTLSTWNGV